MSAESPKDQSHESVFKTTKENRSPFLDKNLEPRLNRLLGVSEKRGSNIVSKIKEDIDKVVKIFESKPRNQEECDTQGVLYVEYAAYISNFINSIPKAEDRERMKTLIDPLLVAIHDAIEKLAELNNTAVEEVSTQTLENQFKETLNTAMKTDSEPVEQETDQGDTKKGEKIENAEEEPVQKPTGDQKKSKRGAKATTAGGFQDLILNDEGQIATKTTPQEKVADADTQKVGPEQSLTLKTKDRRSLGKKEVDNVTTLDTLEAFLVDKLSLEDVRITEKVGDSFLEQAKVILNKELEEAKENPSHLKSLQEKILKLEGKLNELYVFTGNKSGPFTREGDGIGSGLPENDNKDIKRGLLIRLYTGFTYILKDILEIQEVNKDNDSKTEERQNKQPVEQREVVKELPRIDTFRDLKDFLCGVFLSPEVRVTKDNGENFLQETYALLHAEWQDLDETNLEAVKKLQTNILRLENDIDSVVGFRDGEGMGANIPEDTINNGNRKNKIFLLRRLHVQFGKLLKAIQNILNEPEPVEATQQEKAVPKKEGGQEVKKKKSQKVNRVTMKELEEQAEDALLGKVEAPAEGKHELWASKKTLARQRQNTEKKLEEKEVTLEDMLANIIIHDDASFDDEASFANLKTIKSDVGFSDWIERVAARNEATQGQQYIARDLASWHTEYLKQKETIGTLETILKGTSIFDREFEKFTTPEEKKFAKEKLLKDLEWDMVVFPRETERAIQSILESKTKTEKQAEQIKQLEKQKNTIERALADTGMRIEGDVTFDIIHGENSEKKKVWALEDFLADMDNNYKYYHGPVDGTDSPRDIRRMFRLYTEAKRDKLDGGNKKIGLLARTFGKIKRYWKKDIVDYGDSNAFEANIKLLQAEKLVPTETTSVEEANQNMMHMRHIIRTVQSSMNDAHQLSLDEALETIPGGEPMKEKFRKILAFYIKNRGTHSSLQLQARKGTESTEHMANFDAKIRTEKSKLQQQEIDTASALIERYQNPLSFEMDVKNEFTLYRLQTLSNDLKKPIKDRDAAQSLNRISKDLESIVVDNGMSDEKIGRASCRERV